MKTNRIWDIGYQMLAALLMLGCVAPLRAADADDTLELRDFIGAVYEKAGTWTLTSGQNALGDRDCDRKFLKQRQSRVGVEPPKPPSLNPKWNPRAEPPELN